METKSKYKKNYLVYFLGHRLKITKVIYHPFGYSYNLSCYAAGCCTIPNILELKCSEKFLENHEGKDIEVEYVGDNNK